MGNPTFCCAGLFITWWIIEIISNTNDDDEIMVTSVPGRWGYLAMNSASTLGVEGTRWLQSAKGTVTSAITRAD